MTSCGRNLFTKRECSYKQYVKEITVVSASGKPCIISLLVTDSKDLLTFLLTTWLQSCPPRSYVILEDMSVMSLLLLIVNCLSVSCFTLFTSVPSSIKAEVIMYYSSIVMTPVTVEVFAAVLMSYKRHRMAYYLKIVEAKLTAHCAWADFGKCCSQSVTRTDSQGPPPSCS